MFKALIALGNPGKEYARTYHNVGVFVARQCMEHAASEGVDLELYEPTTFMNMSGPAVERWMRYKSLTSQDIVVIHDDGDFAVGEYKLSTGGGSAGHNGVESLIVALGTVEFSRLRIGIRDPKEATRTKTADFVLNEWGSRDEAIFKEVAAKAWKELL